METIPEGKAIPLTLASPQHRINIEVSEEAVFVNNKKTDETVTSSTPVVKKNLSKLAGECFVRMRTDNNNVTNNSIKINNDEVMVKDQDEEENLHAMSRYELLQVLRRTRDEKKGYRRRIKEMEEAFKRETGRKLLKEDREGKVFQLYKNAKAKIKLIDALLSKKGGSSDSYY